jgi:geranylgeranyl pyrophosphate synthase
MRAANDLFVDAELARLAPRIRTKMSSSGVGQDSESDPLATHEGIAYDWLVRGGKRSRPFITLAAYDALRGAPATKSMEGIGLSDAVRRTALAIEAFHKASLVHDDIEDDDEFRYGAETLHRRHGVSAAINIGDYLIGLGYRLVSRQRQELGSDCAADILDRFADAHLRLSEGQGAELLWRDARIKSLSPLDALKIYALKTAPAFEAALFAGLRLAGPTEAYEKLVVEFSRHLGVAFQILNDLNDWHRDDTNKCVSGADLLAARPTLLLALALEGAAPAAAQELLNLVSDGNASGIGHAAKKPDTAELVIARARELYLQANVFEKAERLIEKYRARAEAVADEAEPIELRELLYYLVDTVLERSCTSVAEPELLQLGAH